MIFGLNRFHLLCLLTWQTFIFFTTQLIFPIFLNYVPKWRCGSEGSFARNCTAYTECPGPVEFENSYFHSAAQEFDLVCGSAVMWTTVLSQVQFAGVLIGNIVSGMISDAVGRKPVTVAAYVLGLTMAVVTGYAQSLQVLIPARFCIGLAVGGMIVVGFTYVTEMLLPKQRMLLRGVFNWGVGRILLTLICWKFNCWRTASFACMVVAAPALFIVLTLFPESPTWLHYKGKLVQMRASERWIARVAGVEYVEAKHDPITDQRGLLSVLKDRKVMRRVGVLWLMWFTACLTSYALDLNSPTISGNLFVNQLTFSCMILLSKYVLLFVDTTFPHFSRRMLHQGGQAVALVCFICLVALVLADYDGLFILALNVFAVMFVELTWDANYLCGIECTPTNMRASVLGSCSLMARVGALIAPLLALLNTQVPYGAYLSVFVLGAVNLAVSYRFLVETKGVNLDHVDVKVDTMEVQEQDDMLESPPRKLSQTTSP